MKTVAYEIGLRDGEGGGVVIKVDFMIAILVTGDLIRWLYNWCADADEQVICLQRCDQRFASV